MDLLRCVWASIRCKERVSERQIIASQLELVELDCGWGPHSRTANCRCCTDSWPPVHSDGHSLHSYTPLLSSAALVSSSCIPASRVQIPGHKPYSLRQSNWLFMGVHAHLGCYILVETFGKGSFKKTGTVIARRVIPLEHVAQRRAA